MEDVLSQKAVEFLEARKYSNNLIDIIKCVENRNDVSTAAVALEVVFIEVLKRRTMLVSAQAKSDGINSKYVTWLRNCYDSTWDKLLSAVSLYADKQAASTLFTLLREEGRFPILTTTKGKYYFPDHQLQKIISCMIFSMQTNKLVLPLIDEYTDYIDVVYYAWLQVPIIISSVMNPEELFIQNVLLFLEKLPIPSEDELKTNDAEVILCYSKSKPKFRPNYAEMQKCVTTVWNILSKWPHSASTQKQLLVLLNESILSNLVQPVLTLDYLMESLNAGGPIGLLALNAIFVLVKDYNLEHPNIFGKLYNLFDADILQTSHKSRLFYLANIFMSSTHLPEVLVASFAKRMSRLCLRASPQDIIIMSAFIGNLMIRHPGLKIMIHHPNEKIATSDPFLEDEQDPMKTNALTSSLWELQSLQQHVLPKVSRAVEFINRPLPSVEWDLSGLLKATYNEIFERESKKKMHKVSLTFERPNSLAMPRTDYFTQLWSFS